MPIAYILFAAFLGCTTLAGFSVIAWGLAEIFCWLFHKQIDKHFPKPQVKPYKRQHKYHMTAPQIHEDPFMSKPQKQEMITKHFCCQEPNYSSEPLEIEIISPMKIRKADDLTPVTRKILLSYLRKNCQRSVTDDELLSGFYSSFEGYSLTETLIVLLIIGTIILIALPMLSDVLTMVRYFMSLITW